MQYDVITDEDERKLGQLALVVYILQAIGLISGVTAIIGVIINYVKRDESRGTLYESHFVWQIRTFWYALIGGIIGWALSLILVGFLVLGVVWVWYVYRVMRGFLNYNDGKPMPV